MRGDMQMLRIEKEFKYDENFMVLPLSKNVPVDDRVRTVEGHARRKYQGLVI